jgi:cell division protein ZipA
MSELRWILIGFGIVLLAGIYLWGRRGSGAAVASEDAVVRVRSEPPLHARQAPGLHDPGLHDEGSWDEIDDAVAQPGATESAVEPVVAPLRPVMPRSVSQEAMPAATGSRPDDQDSWRGRIEPTLGDATPTEELPAPRPEPVTQAPTLSSSETPLPRRIERRKILSLRLSAAPQRIEGARLLEALQADSLQHGKYQVFHRLHEDGAIIFSIASMVEPGTFDPEKMPQIQYPGITLFAQLPGPVPGMHALNELVACARRLQQALGGTLQDERGVPLTVHRIERLRQEVRDFERPPHGGGRGMGSHAAGH